MKNVFLSVPTRGQIHWQTVTRLEEIRDASSGLRPILYQEGNLSVALTRNKIVKAFLATACDVLVMVDDDTVPPPHMLEALLPHIPEYAMVSIPHPLPVPKSQDVLALSALVLSARGELNGADLAPGLNRVDAVATGCVAISREALVSLGPNPFRIENDPDATITSDDYLFCAALRAAGYRIGCWWDGWYCDHLRVVQLAPLLEGQLRNSNPLLRRR